LVLIGITHVEDKTDRWRGVVAQTINNRQIRSGSDSTRLSKEEIVAVIDHGHRVADGAASINECGECPAEIAVIRI